MKIVKSLVPIIRIIFLFQEDDTDSLDIAEDALGHNNISDGDGEQKKVGEVDLRKGIIIRFYYIRLP